MRARWSSLAFGSLREACVRRSPLPLDTIVIAGGSLAGIRCAEALRRRGFSGRLVFAGAERERPYDRPPLSKELLRGDREPDQIRLNKPDAFDALEPKPE